MSTPWSAQTYMILPKIYQFVRPSLITASFTTEASASMRLGLNKTQTNTFFTSSRQIEVAKETLNQLGKEDIKDVEDL
eukprot:5953065-Ditylum_brightwellii.AAC.1